MEINNEFCKQWKGLVYKIAFKYSHNIMRLELDDLMQIGYIGLLEGAKSYDEASEVPLINYLSICISHTILKEFQSSKRDKRKLNWNSISLSTPTTDTDDMCIGDTIEDFDVDVYQEVEDKLIYLFYESMFYNLLDNKRAYVLKSRLIKGMTFEDISKNLKCSTSGAAYLFETGRKELVKKSPYLREKNKEYYNAYILESSSFYKGTPEAAIMKKSLLWEV